MNKQELVDFVVEGTGLTKAASKQAVEATLEGMEKGLQDGGKVNIAGFGTFSVKKQKARNGRNPQTGEPIEIPAKNVVKFTPGKNLRDAIE